MKVIFYSDVHLGRVPMSHATPESRQRFREKLFHPLQEKLHELQHGKFNDRTFTICAGDLFDKFQVSNEDWMRGWRLVCNSDAVLAGNHDMINRNDRVSSIQVLHHSLPKVYLASQGQDTVYDLDTGDGGPKIVMVPHHSSQDHFDRALERAKKLGGDLLVLHATYDLKFAEESDISLNLTEAQAKDLLTKFDYIVMGHEHNPNTYLDGRVIMLGSHMPMTFGEVTDKYLWIYDSLLKTFSKELVWSKGEHYLELSVDDEVPSNLAGIEYIEMKGTVNYDNILSYSAKLKQIWEGAPDLLMFRQNVEVVGADDVLVQADEGAAIEDLLGILDQKLMGTGLESLWREYRDQAHQG